MEIKAVIFDLDGVLVEKFTTTPLTGAKERIASLKEQGTPIAIATNQAGPIWYFATQDPKYPSTKELIENIKAIVDALDIDEVPYLISIGDVRARNIMGNEPYYAALLSIQKEIVAHLDPALFHARGLESWRKPNPGMLFAVAAHLNIALEQCLYVGDQETDRQAAEAAGMMFEASALVR